MKKLAIVFVVAVLVPSVVLAWLAMRSIRDQEIVVQSQLALLHQARTDSLASDLRVAMDDIRSYFGKLVEDLSSEHETNLLCTDFDNIVRSQWGQAMTGCVVTESGDLLAPKLDSSEPRVQEFLRENRLFLTNRIVAEVYQPPMPVGNVIQLETMEQENTAPNADVRTKAAQSVQADPTPAAANEVVADAGVADQEQQPLAQRSRSKVAVITGKLGVMQQNRTQNSFEEYTDGNGGEVQLDTELTAAIQGQNNDVASPQHSSLNSQQLRKVAPLSQIGYGDLPGAAQVAEQALEGNFNANNWSMFQSANGEVREIIGDKPEGALSRFLEDGLHILLWYRHPEIASRIFWVELDLNEIRKDLASIIDLSARSDPSRNVCVALLDADSRPVAMTKPGFSTDWKKPFVASEVGEILPHWEVAAYFFNPDEIASSARAVRWMLWLLVPILLAAIGFGSVVIIRDVGREMAAARQKTDFVSNVSHELKTPLTSIRMFSDLLGTREGIESPKMRNYAGIISTEAARLTRLINNLLDFSRMERGERKYQMMPFDAIELASEVVENYRLQIESEGIELKFVNRIGAAAPVQGDRDALAQVLLNLLANAEKYGAAGGEIVVEARRSDSDNDYVELRVLDRGPGVSKREAHRVFEKFYRVDDSLSTGIQGSGLGLTLARQIARGHGGDVECCKRDDGECGGCFALVLPLTEE